MNKSHRFRGLFFTVIFIALSVAIVFYRQDIYDWWQLRNYEPSAEVEKIANANGLNQTGIRYLYLGSPVIEDRQQFNSHCGNTGEKTIILGCYNGRYIYLYNVTDERLAGVKEVTAVHEMLHVAYDRLSSEERSKVNELLRQQFDQVEDQRVRDLIDQYRRNDESQLLNEMHSIFGTEVGNLIAPLEEYYSQYFTNRQTVVNLAMQYESQFIEGREQIATLDEQLLQLKQSIAENETAIETQNSELTAESRRFDALRHRNPDAHNGAVSEYNQKVEAYNALIAQTKDLIKQHNDLVVQRNQVANNYNDLAEGLDSSIQTEPLPAPTQ